MSLDHQISPNPSSPVTGNPISSDDNGSSVTHLNQIAPTNGIPQDQKINNRNANIEKDEADASSLDPQISPNPSSPVTGNPISSDGNGSLVIHLDQTAPTNGIPQDQKINNRNADIEKDEIDATSLDPQISPNPSSPVIGNPISSDGNGSLVTHLDQTAPTNGKSNNQNANIEKDEIDETQYKYLDPQISPNPSSPVTRNPISSDDNSSSVTLLNKPAPTNGIPQDQKINNRNADIEKDEIDETQYKYLDPHMSLDPQTSPNPSSPVTGNPISSDDNGSSVTQLNKPTPTNEIPQDQKSNNRNADIEKDEIVIDETQYKYLVKRFNFKIILSTFACSLVVACITFVNNVARAVSVGRINYADGTPYNIFMLLAYLSISLHAMSSIISSRGAVLCSDPELIKEREYTVEEFKDILSLCQHLTLHGIMLFALAVFGSSFFVFKNYAYPAVFCGFSLVVVVLIFIGKYRKLSLIHKDLTQIWNGIKAALRSGGKRLVF